MARYRMTPKRRAALRKAQLASARKRRKGLSRKKKVAIGIVAGVAVGSVLGYRSYDRRVESAQKAHLSAKAWTVRVKSMPMEFEDDLYHANKPVPRQPRRYRNKPLSQQTKLSIAQHKKTVVGRKLAKAERVITKPAPYQVRTTIRRHQSKQSGPRFQHLGLSRSHVFGTRVGKTRASISIRKTNVSRSKYNGR